MLFADIICGGEDTHLGVLVLRGADVGHLLIVTLHAWRPPHLNLEPMVNETAVIPLLIKIVHPIVHPIVHTWYTWYIWYTLMYILSPSRRFLHTPLPWLPLASAEK